MVRPRSRCAHPDDESRTRPGLHTERGRTLSAPNLRLLMTRPLTLTTELTIGPVTVPSTVRTATGVHAPQNDPVNARREAMVEPRVTPLQRRSRGSHHRRVAARPRERDAPGQTLDGRSPCPPAQEVFAGTDAGVVVRFDVFLAASLDRGRSARITGDFQSGMRSPGAGQAVFRSERHAAATHAGPPVRER